MIKIPPPNSGVSSINQLVPITIITGFLGSGKTTIIKNLIDQINQDNLKIVYIKNEAGDMDVDTKLVIGSQIVSQELLNGCVCCTLTGPLLTAIDELIEKFSPDRIIIETSGTAEPANMAITLGGARNIYRDGVICVIDTLNYNYIPEYSDHYQIQAKLTDLIVLNKLELTPSVQVEKVIDQIKLINSYSPIVKATNGRLDKDIAFGNHLKDLDQILQNSHRVHTHQQVDTINLVCDHPLDMDSFKDFCHQLPKNVIRLKGFVFSDKVYVVNQAYQRLEIFAYDNQEINKTKLYAVGFDFEEVKDQILDRFKQIKPRQTTQ